MINGIINVYKEKGFTSFDVVAVMRGIASQKKVGHTGTLDPDAEGVLPICLGNATRLCDMLTDKRKEYVAVFMLGKRTDTLDISGEVLEEKEPSVSKEGLEKAIKSFIGGYNQIPPMYSAKKVDGKRLYDLAREGKEVERKAVFVDIHDIEIQEMELPYFKLRVSCGKGTYIRSLGEDIGKACGELVTMTSLLRTKVSNFKLENAYTLNQLTNLKNEGRLEEVLLPTDAAFIEYPKVNVKPEFRKLLDNGNKLRKNEVTELSEYRDDMTVRVYTEDDIFMGLYKFIQPEKLFKPWKMFIS